MSSATSIQFHLIKNDGQTASKDDFIEIRQTLATGEYTIKFREHNAGIRPMTHFLSNLSYHQVVDYVYALLKNQSLDEDPYQSFQVNLPAMPTVLVSVERLKEVYYRDHFLDSVRDALSTLTNSTTVTHPQQTKRLPPAATDPVAPVRQHLFFE